MKCPNCDKVLNATSVICDNCGALLNDEDTQISFQDVVDKIAIESNESPFSKELQSALTEGLYLSKRIHDTKGLTKHYLKKTLEFILFWTYYETHKKYLLTHQFTTDEAVAVFDTLEQAELNDDAKNLLAKEYPDNITNLTLPKSAFEGIKHPYMIETKYPQYKSSHIIFSYLTLLVKHIITYGVLSLAIVFGLYAANTALSLSIPYLNMIVNTTEYLILIGGIGGIIGSILKRQTFKRLPVRQFINSHPSLTKHIKKHAKDKIKSLKAREERN